MKKIDLVTGFLGSGKTTFIKEYASYLIEKGEKVCILENDFGAVNVDMMLLSNMRTENLELEMVSGGCDMDCHRRRFKTKLIAMGMDDYTRIIVEPSGVFDVDEFFDLLYDDPINRFYEMGSVITIVDADIEKELSENSRYMLASQAAVAGTILLSKVSENSDIAATKALIKDALLEVKCSREIDDIFCEKEWKYLDAQDFSLIENSGYFRASFEKKAMDFTKAFDSVYLLDEKLSLCNIQSLVEKIFADESLGNVFRVKGFCFDNNKWYEINATKKDRRIEEIEEGQDVFIVIGEMLIENRIKELIQVVKIT